MVPGLFATNDTVWICPLMSSNVSTPSTVTTWCAPCTPMKCRVTLSPSLTTIWSGENVNDLKSHAPTLFGAVTLKPPLHCYRLIYYLKQTTTGTLRPFV
jgi:hypothetical protein